MNTHKYFQFGVTNFEKFVKKCVAEGVSLEEEFDQVRNGTKKEEVTQCEYEK